MTIRKPVSSFFLLALFSSATVLGQSQDQTSADKDANKDKEILASYEKIIACYLSPLNVAKVEVEVTDRYGREVDDLSKDDFTIYEDGVKQGN